MFAFKNFPQSPSPEIDIKVIKTLQGCSPSSVFDRVCEVVQYRAFVASSVSEANPRTSAMSVVGSSGFVTIVWRVAYADDHRNFALHFQSFFMLL